VPDVVIISHHQRGPYSMDDAVTET